MTVDGLGKRPSFLITIDTEGDSQWAKPREITTRNAGYLDRFQRACEASGFRPTYLTNYEMATSAVFQEFAADVLKRDAGEIGMHLHPWNNPPILPLTSDDLKYHPYLIEYPEDVMRKKVEVITDVLEDTFGIKVISHRAGRWSFNETYARILVERGYTVDCSVTPYVSWRHRLGDPAKHGGTDYSRFPRDAYFVDLDDISRPGHSPLLEVPVTILPNRPRWVAWLERAFGGVPKVRGALRRMFPPVSWLRPNGMNRREMLRIVKQAARTQRSYVEFMLHSSELMPGGSPTFPDANDIEKLYADLEALFAEASRTFEGATLREFAATFTGVPNGRAVGTRL